MFEVSSYTRFVLFYYIAVLCFSCSESHLASCSFPGNTSFSADKFCPYPPSISVTEPLPVMTNNSQPLEYVSYFVDEELIRLADRVFDTSDFFRRYMAGFVISTRENVVSHCGTDYVRNVNDFGKLDTKDLMCMMLGFSPIVESDSLFTDTEFRRSVISNQSRHDLINCFFSHLSNEYQFFF